MSGKEIHMSDVVWQAIIAGVVTIILAWLQNRTKNAVVKTGEDAAKKTLELDTAKLEKLDTIEKKVDDVHKTTNGMNTALQDAAFARGVKSEVDREKST
jgi:hypothetical protein